MKKNYVLDTNILISDPECIFKFEDNDIYISLITLKEINKLKNADGEVGFMARIVKRVLDDLRNDGNIKDGLSLGEDRGKFYILEDETFSEFLPLMSKDENDDHILAGASFLALNSKIPTVLVTNDIDLAFLCDLIGLKTEKYLNQNVDKKLYTGRTIIDVEPEIIDLWYKDKILPYDNLVYNEYVMMKDWKGRSALGKYNGKNIVPLPYYDEDKRPFDVIAKNNGQRFFIDALMSPVEECPLVIARGPAGTAKTFLSLACGLEQVLNENKYNGILITRSNTMFDSSLGYLPGSELSKVTPIIRPFMDNLEVLFKDSEYTYKDGVKLPSIAEELMMRNIIRAESMEFMRGRSLSNTFVIIDEAQNVTQSQILSIVSRIGENSKIVLIGDPEQIDRKFLSKNNNGLVFASDRFVGSKLCAQIEFKKSECVRSELAKEAAERLTL